MTIKCPLASIDLPPNVSEFYTGLIEVEKNYRDVKHDRRRKRWL